MRYSDLVPSGKAIALTIVAALSITSAPAGERNIEGNWKTNQGNTAAILKCGNSYCITLKTGDYAGKTIGRMARNGGKYTGTVTDPANDRTYSGSINVSGSSLKMQGCALRIFCRTQTWKRL